MKAWKLTYLASISQTSGSIFLGAWVSVWITVACIVDRIDYKDYPELYWFEAFYRIGSLIFGGGQVVLPLLLHDEDACVAAGGSIVPNDVNFTCLAVVRITKADAWITEEQFFVGLGLVQAIPGPIFNLSAYIGAVAASRMGTNILAGIFAEWFGLSGPGIMILFGILPFWNEFRKLPWYRAALPGLNSSAVGLVVAAVIQMSFKVKDISPDKDLSVVIGMLAFCVSFFGIPVGSKETDIWSVPAPLIVIGGGGLGVLAWLCLVIYFLPDVGFRRAGLVAPTAKVDAKEMVCCLRDKGINRVFVVPDSAKLLKISPTQTTRSQDRGAAVGYTS